MRDAVQAIASETFDVAIIEQIFLAPYRKLIQAPVILAEQNVESSLLAQAAGASFYGQFTAGFEASTKEAELLRQYEDEVWPEFAWRTAVSEKDRCIIQQRAKRGETWLVANGIDVDEQMIDAPPDTNNVLFTGALAYYPNVDAVIYFWKEIWPHVLKLNSSAKLIVAGRTPSRDISALAASAGFKLVADPDDMRAIAAQCSVSICPLRIGSGTRLKILEAMAFGSPVVSTSIGCEGLAVEDERDLLIRDDPAEFAFAVHRVLKDADLWRKLRENGRQLVTERYSWDTVLEPLDRLCRKIASEH
jgi:glycosyltransferase involved in cell wall biosynthesis